MPDRDIRNDREILIDAMNDSIGHDFPARAVLQEIVDADLNIHDALIALARRVAVAEKGQEGNR